MQKKMKLTIAILLTTLTACGQITKSTTKKTNIDLEAVAYVEIKQELYDSLTVRLPDKQAVEFVTIWNNSKSIGPCKYMPKLWLTVILKDGTTRTFRANGENIKEDKDWCYSIGDSEYFDDLWTASKKE